MRDPKRIDRIVEILRNAWGRETDLRLGQLLSNLNVDFNTEDCLLEEKLRLFAKTGCLHHRAYYSSPATCMDCKNPVPGTGITDRNLFCKDCGRDHKEP